MEWLNSALITGFQKLLCLGLDRTPATDLIQGTVMAWVEAITTGREWDEQRDAGRIAAAFVTLAQTRESWPQPKHFLDALPRVEQAAIGYEVKPATPEEAAKALKKISEILGERMPAHNAAKAKHEGEQIDKAAIEADLQRHYGDRKQAAAGDAP